MTLQTGVSYFSARTLRHVQADLADMVAHHCTYVVHCLTETDLAYYADTMREIVRATHLAAWSYEGTASMSRVRCARPEVMWSILGEAFAELRDSEQPT